MSDENKVGTYPFVAEPFHVDFMERLTMGVLGNHLLNCAGFHAAERGFGIATLNENHYTWVLSRLAIEMEEMPRAYEKFSVQTWVENVYRLFTDRNFAILNQEGKPIGYARSIWAMISMETRKPADLLTLAEALRIMSARRIVRLPSPAASRWKNSRHWTSIRSVTATLI